MNNRAFSFQTLTPELILNSLATIGIYVESGLPAFLMKIALVMSLNIIVLIAGINYKLLKNINLLSN